MEGGTDRGVLGAYVSYAVSSSTVVSSLYWIHSTVFTLLSLHYNLYLYCFHFTVFYLRKEAAADGMQQRVGGM